MKLLIGALVLGGAMALGRRERSALSGQEEKWETQPLLLSRHCIGNPITDGRCTYSATISHRPYMVYSTPYFETSYHALEALAKKLKDAGYWE
jgi:hypothetical protein